MNGNNSFYRYFKNESFISNFKGFIGFGIRELNQTEYEMYCNKSQPLIEIPLVNELKFKNDFSIRVFTSGCHYYDKSIHEWTSHGINVIEDTNITHTHCNSSHLTEFSSGYTLLSPLIDFEHVSQTADIQKNPIIYFAVIACCISYLIVAVWSHYMDRKDKAKVTLNVMLDNATDDNYFYEIITHTGSMKEAGTQSNVNML